MSKNEIVTTLLDAVALFSFLGVCGLAYVIFEHI